MKKLIALIFPFLFSCQQERLDLPKSVVDGGWDSCIGRFVFDSNTGKCYFNSSAYLLSGSYYVAERTIIISCNDNSVLRLVIKHYDSQYITCDLECRVGYSPVTLIKIN